MRRLRNPFLTLFILLLCSNVFAEEKTAPHASAIKWQDFNDERFAEAKKTKKLLLLNLEAIWCHWCHVMEKETYGNADVAKKLSAGFILTKADQDSRPDLSTRYNDYGWPATIIFDAAGRELRKLAGYVEPQEFSRILDEVVKNPVPQEGKGHQDVEFVKDAALAADYKQILIDKHYNSLDMEKGGLRTSHRYLEADTVEYSLTKALKSDRDAAWVKTTLTANLKLIDPAWGGVYQYSTRYGWDHPHYEKIMKTQADNLTFYSLGYAFWGEEAQWKAATAVYLYLKNFLTDPQGAFYTSQDADLKKGEHSAEYFNLPDAERLKLGKPAIDKNIYSRENGLAIQALADFYSATGNEIVLTDAVKAANWIKANRALPGGGFSHAAKDTHGPFLGDNLAMGEALLSLYAVIGDRAWLGQAEAAAGFVKSNFSDLQAGGQLVPGFFSDKQKSGSALKPLKKLAQNIRLARWFNRLYHFTGKAEYRELAKAAMQFAATPAYGSGDINDSGILVADFELGVAPLHITVVGQKDDPAAKQLFSAGLKYFSTYKRLEWWDKREGAMPNPDVEYPQMSKAAAFICTNKRCSLPIFKPEGIADTIKLLIKD